MKRSNAPIFWSLFGAGGMLSALLGPALVFVTGIAIPVGLILPANTMDFVRMHGFAAHWAGKAFIFAVITLFLWHAVHRIFHSLHDIGVHTGAIAKIVCYGFAMAGTVIAAWALVAIGF